MDSIKRFITLALAGMVICYVSPIIKAQETGLSLSPSLTEILSKPSNTLELHFRLENLGDPALVGLKIVSFQPSDCLGNIALSQTAKKPIQFSSPDYSFTSKKPFIMKSHELKKLTISMEIPETTKEGDYYYSLVASTDPPPGQEGTVAARASIAIVSNILISVAKNYPKTAEAKVVLFDIPESHLINFFGKNIKLVNSSKPFSAILTIQNKGIHRIKPEGSINLYAKKQLLKSYTLSPQNILAQWQRTLQTSISHRSGESSLVINTINPGSYELKTKLAVPSTQSDISASIDFIALPFNLIYVSVIVLCIVFCTIFLRKRRRDPDFESE